MTPEMNWDNIEIDHVKPTRSFNVSNDELLKDAFSWKKPQLLFKKIHQQKATKCNVLDYQLQLIRAYQFIELKEEGFNEDFH